MKKTKIICTIGPKTESKETLVQLLFAGMNVMRLNFSHGSHAEHAVRVDNLRAVMKDTGMNAAIMLDTKGPEIRTMKLQGGEEVSLVAGQVFTLTTDQSVVGDKNQVAVTYPHLANDLHVGARVLIDDGLLALDVVEIKENQIICQVLNNGMLGENKGVNLPNIVIGLPAISEKDEKDLIWGCQQGVDFIAASFIRKRSDVETIREVLKRHGGEQIQIISKIENQEGLDNFDEILAASDGIMVARGDLGVEIPVEDVILAQKMMITKCNIAAKPVITATQMLDSMIYNPRPTRAEAGDVANAILDGTDAVMLSGESAKGKYPVEAVRVMSTICQRTDAIIPAKLAHNLLLCDSSMDAVSSGAVDIAERLAAQLIIVLTRQGGSVRAIRKYFPTAQILALTDNEKMVQKLLLIKGVTSQLIETLPSIDAYYQLGKKIAAESGLANKGDKIVMVSGPLTNNKGILNTTSVHII